MYRLVLEPHHLYTAELFIQTSLEGLELFNGRERRTNGILQTLSAVSYR